MTYSVSILRRAQRELGDLPSGTYERVRDSIRQLSEHPRPHGSRKLSGRDGWRIRCGDYRVIYEIDDANPIGDRAAHWPPSGRLSVAAVRPLDSRMAVRPEPFDLAQDRLVEGRTASISDCF